MEEDNIMPAYMTGKNKEQDFFPTGPSRPQAQGYDMSQIFGHQDRQMQNLRSPMVRRNMSGQVVDENAPTGLDWLRENGPNRPDPMQGNHSWDQQGSTVDQGMYQVLLQQMQDQQPQQTDVGQFMQTPYGPVGTGMQRNVDAPTGPFLQGERGDIRNELAQAAATSRPQKQAARPSAQQTAPQPTKAQELYASPNPTKPSTQQAVQQFKSKSIADREMAKRQGRMDSGEIPQDFYTNPESPFNQPFARDPQVSASQDPYKTALIQANNAMMGDQPGVFPMIGRGAQLGGAKAIDDLLNLIWRSKSEQGYPLTNRTSQSILRNR